MENKISKSQKLTSLKGASLAGKGRYIEPAVYLLPGNL
jgi:hypothetical protein